MRVIAGKYKRFPLETLEGNATRPTYDKVKESMFNIIGPYFEADTVLDLYAGTGNLGIEAVSRGIKHAYLVDNNRKAIEVINRNVEKTGEPERFTVIHQSAEAAIDKLSGQGIKMNLVLLDPPYHMDTLEEIMKLLWSRDILSKRALIVCETHSRIKLPEKIETIEQIRVQKYGKTCLTIYQNQAPLSAEEMAAWGPVETEGEDD